MRQADYAALRAAVLDRDGHRCQLCGGSATQIDHKWPQSLGGGHQVRNLQAVCKSCNSKKRDHVEGIPPITADPECPHCHLGRVLKAGLCNPCFAYRERTGILPPQKILDRRIDRLVAATNRSVDWIVGGNIGGTTGGARTPRNGNRPVNRR